MEPLTVGTVITKSYLAHARALARSLARDNPGARLFVLLVDRPDGCFDPAAEPFTLLQLTDLFPGDDVRDMLFYYNPFEAANAFKAWLHDYLWTHSPTDTWLYIDSDMMVTGSLQPVIDELRSTSILLTAHNTRILESPLIDPYETAFLQGGIYNGGMVGIRRTTEARRFIDWFKARMQFHCLQVVNGLFVDQLWLNMVTTVFPDHALCTHPGVNLGHWNLRNRTLSRDERGQVLADGRPVLLTHFSGWSIDEPGEVSKWAPIYSGKAPPEWGDLGVQYRELLLGSGYRQVREWPYSFGQFDSGHPITPDMRRKHWEARRNGTGCTGSPFARYDCFRTVFPTPTVHELAAQLDESTKRHQQIREALGSFEALSPQDVEAAYRWRRFRIQHPGLAARLWRLMKKGRPVGAPDPAPPKKGSATR